MINFSSSALQAPISQSRFYNSFFTKTIQWGYQTRHQQWSNEESYSFHEFKQIFRTYHPDANLNSKVSHHHHSCHCLHMTFRTAKDITRRRWRSEQQRTFNTKPWRSKHYLLEVHGPWILVEFSGLLLEIATIAFVFKVCELDSPFLNILKLWSHLQISPCFALGHKIMSLLSSFVLFCLFLSVQEELRKIKGCNKNRWLESYYKRICKQETQSQCSENLQFYLYLRRIRCCEHANRFKRISLMLQKEIPNAMRPLATASSSSSVYQKIERFSSTIACVKTTELLLKVWIMSQTTTEIWSSFFGEKKERKWNCVPRELTVDEQLLLPRLILQTLRLLAPFFLVTSQSSSRASSLFLPSFLPSFLLSFLPCTALRKGESDHRRHSLRLYMISTECTSKGTHRVSHEVCFFCPVS